MPHRRHGVWDTRHNSGCGDWAWRPGWAGMAGMASVTVGTEPLTRAEVRAVARDGVRVELNAEARAAVGLARQHIDALAADPEPHYGVSTGFGALATTHIPPQRRAAL